MLVVVGATFRTIRISMLLFFVCGFGVNADAALSWRASAFISKPRT